MKTVQLFTLAMLLVSSTLAAQTKATLRIDASKTHQHITGFGGFVCSPQFTYNHMSETEIRKVWGKNSTIGCNIMRMYLPVGRNAWSQSLNTAKLAKQLGLIVFASPWGQPAEWKTNNSSNARNSEGEEGRLKKENWADYAKYLDDYVKYLRQNGVELDAISIQNEPDWPCDYAGCLWSTSEMAEFVRTYGRQISCKIIAPESIGCSDSYVNALSATNTIDCFDIYGGHQYGGIGSAYKNLAKKGKEVWMTEYLINWNEGKSDADKRNYDFSKDFFDFYRAINTCMLGDFNAWIHYASKRYYAMMGDGTTGAGGSGVITKRGYIMAHFARFVTGMTRIEGTFTDGGMEGTYYKSTTGDTIIAVLANNSDVTYRLTVDLPFYTEGGKLYTTNQTKSFTLTNIQTEGETCRPEAEVAAQSVVTLWFTKSRERMASNMKGTTKRFDRIDDMTPSRNTFGTNYKLSGKTKTFDHENPLISTRTNIVLGYLALDNRYSRLVMNIKKVTSASNYTSSQTTLYYVNSAGNLSKHDYGELSLGARENFSLVFDISPKTLTDGCIGILSLTNNNYNSKLSITFGDVYFANEGQYAATLSGAYVADDSYVMDYTNDPSCTSIDLTAVTDLPTELPWLNGKNRVAYVSETQTVNGPNIIVGDQCKSLRLYDTGGDFRPTKAFIADEASISFNKDWIFTFAIPFSAQIPEGYRAYVIEDDFSITQMRSIPANKPVIILDELNFVHFANQTRSEFYTEIKGNGEVSIEQCPVNAQVRYTYTKMMLYPGDYIFDESAIVFRKIENEREIPPFSIYAIVENGERQIILDKENTAIQDLTTTLSQGEKSIYNLQGQRLSAPSKGINIINGRKVFVK